MVEDFITGVRVPDWIDIDYGQLDILINGNFLAVVLQLQQNWMNEESNGMDGNC